MRFGLQPQARSFLNTGCCLGYRHESARSVSRDSGFKSPIRPNPSYGLGFRVLEDMPWASSGCLLHDPVYTHFVWVVILDGLVYRDGLLLCYPGLSFETDSSESLACIYISKPVGRQAVRWVSMYACMQAGMHGCKNACRYVYGHVTCVSNWRYDSVWGGVSRNLELLMTTDKPQLTCS